jgi:hypothetical protein
MLGRYTMVRGAPAASLPPGRREDTRRHTRHPLRPPRALVDAFLADPEGAGAWRAFEAGYLKTLRARFEADRAPFDALAERARREDVLLGCSCPTQRNPDVRRCHTVLALRFMKTRYPDLQVDAPPT